MEASISYLLYFASLFVTVSPLPQLAEEDSISYQEWVVSDTLHLHLAGPSYEVSFFRDDIIFLSTLYEGIGRVPMDQAEISVRKPLFTNDPESYPPAGISFTSDMHTCYCTRYLEKPGEFRLEKIFEMSYDSGYCSRPQQVFFTRDSCRYLHPCLSYDDSTMVFASDRLPTSGGLDLFLVRLTSDGWSEPVSLGPLINSSGHERYPFLDHRNNLYFSSTGYSGYGGYDIYVCRFNGLDWEQPQNLGSHINTPMDEIGWSVHRSGTEALFTRKSLSEGTAIRKHLSERSTEQDISLIFQKLADPPVEVASEPPSSTEPAPVVQADSMTEKAATGSQDQLQDPQKLIFRVQILSSANANSTPSVVIEGRPYNTHEYYYKGAYRITVGEFETVEEANNFRLQCRRAGFNQAFVAAFRGENRETDPSVFKN